MLKKIFAVALGFGISDAAFADATPQPVWPNSYTSSAMSAEVRADQIPVSKGVGDGWTGGPNYATSNGGQPVVDGIIPQNSSAMPLASKEFVVDDGTRVLSATLPPGYPMDDPQIAGAQYSERKDVVPEDESNQIIQDMVRDWVAKEGMTLREILQQWADIEGWELVWNTKREYPLKASAIFRGRFKDVSSAIIRNFGRATPQPMAKYYFGNRVLVIRTLEEHDGN